MRLWSTISTDIIGHVHHILMCMYFLKYYRFFEDCQFDFYYLLWIYLLWILSLQCIRSCCTCTLCFLIMWPPLYYEIINTRILSGTYILTSIYVPNFIVRGWSHEKDKQFVAIDRAPVVMLMFICNISKWLELKIVNQKYSIDHELYVSIDLSIYFIDLIYNIYF